MAEEKVEALELSEKVEAAVEPTDEKNLSSNDAFITEKNRLDREFKLPITGSRTAKWWYSAFHNITAMVGAGVLGLPNSMVYLGWYGGVTMQVSQWICTLYTLWQMVDLHEYKGHRFNRYHELAQYAFGKTLGLWMTIPFQLIVMVGLDIVYCVTGGKSMRTAYQLTCSEPCTAFGLSAWILVFMGMQVILSQLPNFNSLAVISLLAAIMSISYSTIGIGLSSNAARQNTVTPDYTLDGFSTANGIFGIFNALGTVAFAYGGHNVVLEIQSSLPSKPGKGENPTKKPMMRGVYTAYALVAYCYFGVAFSGYAAFGNQTKDNILDSVSHPVWAVVMAKIFVVIHVLGSFQVYAMPVFDMIETQLVKRNISNGTVTRLIYRTIYVGIVGFVGITIPFFGDLLGFIGALAFGPTTYSLPAGMWLAIRKPPMSSWHFWVSWFIVIWGIIITILGSIGGMRGIIVDASGYDFYQ